MTTAATTTATPLPAPPSSPDAPARPVVASSTAAQHHAVVISDVQLLDPVQLATLRALTADASNDDLTFAGFVRLFVATSTTYLDDIRSAAAAGDHRRLAHAAHTLKGAALQMGAHRLGTVAQRVDRAARDGACRLADVDALVGVVADTHAALQAACVGGDASGG